MDPLAHGVGTKMERGGNNRDGLMLSRQEDNVGRVAPGAEERSGAELDVPVLLSLEPGESRAAPPSQRAVRVWAKPAKA